MAPGLSYALLCCTLLLGPALVSGAPTSGEAILEPDCSYAYLDQCGKHLFLWTADADEVGAPSTAEELEEHCKRQEAAEKCTRARAENCTVGLAKGSSRLFLDAIRDEFEARCDPSTEEYKTYLKIAPCMNSISDAMRDCSMRFIWATDRTANDVAGKSFRQKVPRACCNFVIYSECMYSAARKCGAEGEALMKHMVSTSAGDLVDIACGSYEPNSEVCVKHTRQAKDIVYDPENSDYKGIRTMISSLGKLAEALSTH